MNFNEYRNKNSYSAKSIRVQNSHVNRFKDWCISQNISLEEINYNQVLQFINSERTQGILNQSIIREINSIRIYFDYLLEIGTVKQNIIKRIKIRQSVKKLNPEIIDSRQIRTSVIMNWLKTNNIRQVQYMAGHKSIRSTEQYRNQDLTDLAKQLELFNPMR